MFQDSICSRVFRDSLALAQGGCSFGWAAQVCKCFSDHGKSQLVVAGAPIEVQPDSLPEACEQRWQVAFDAVSLDQAWLSSS